MAISIISNAIANDNTLTVPTHQRGDLLMAIVYRHDSNGSPTTPSGWDWTSQNYILANTSHLVFATKPATSSSESFGTWTSATQVGCIVLRGASQKVIARGLRATSSGTTDTISYSTMAGSSWAGTPGSFFQIGMCGNRSNSASAQAAPTGMTNINSIVGASSGALAFHNITGHSSWTTQTVAGSDLTAWLAISVELYEMTALPSGGSWGSF